MERLCMTLNTWWWTWLLFNIKFNINVLSSEWQLTWLISVAIAISFMVLMMLLLINNPTSFTWMCSWLDRKTQSCLSELITSFVIPVIQTANVWVSEAKLWKDILGMLNLRRSTGLWSAQCGNIDWCITHTDVAIIDLYALGCTEV